ncbi:MAG TPA: hypothetical protein VH142_12215 [Polyangiaceae bacterium]|jgi:hypothetical protein|nr:hypothetical protein [Polyangiaceae bacterium]
MSHIELRIVEATKAQPCEHCARDVAPGEKIVFYPNKPRGVAHLECHLQRPRATSP